MLEVTILLKKSFECSCYCIFFQRIQKKNYKTYAKIFFLKKNKYIIRSATPQ
jgi:hypothetical protein